MNKQGIVLHGITVRLEKKIPVGTDPANRPVYANEFVDVDNVLVGRPEEKEIVELLNLTGRRIEYTLGIPKDDANDWVDKKVIFWGKTFHTVGQPIRGISELIPMEWDQNVRVELIE